MSTYQIGDRVKALFDAGEAYEDWYEGVVCRVKRGKDSIKIQVKFDADNTKRTFSEQHIESGELQRLDDPPSHAMESHETATTEEKEEEVAAVEEQPKDAEEHAQPVAQVQTERPACPLATALRDWDASRRDRDALSVLIAANVVYTSLPEELRPTWTEGAPVRNMRLEEDEEPSMIDPVLAQLTRALDDSPTITLSEKRAMQHIFLVIASYCKLEDVHASVRDPVPGAHPSTLRQALEAAHFDSEAATFVDIMDAYQVADFPMSVGIPAGRFQAAPKELPLLLIERISNMYHTDFFNTPELPSAAAMYERLYTNIRGCGKVFRRLQSWRQVERLNLVDGNVEISTLHPPQGSFVSLKELNPPMAPQDGMAWMRSVPWATLITDTITRWIQAYPNTEGILNEKRAGMIREYRDCELENFLCEERRNRKKFPSWRNAL